MRGHPHCAEFVAPRYLRSCSFVGAGRRMHDDANNSVCCRDFFVFVFFFCSLSFFVSCLSFVVRPRNDAMRENDDMT